MEAEVFIMEIEIKKLTPDIADEYAKFFDTVTHNAPNSGDKCYCVTFCGDGVYRNGGKHWYSSAEERRLHGIQRVRDGYIQGYLACLNGEAVGWCNANTKEDCQEVMNYMRSVGVPVDVCRAGEKGKFVFCFAVAPNVQEMGVATKLLEYICQDATAEGFDFIEAYTHKEFTPDEFRGPLTMYEKCGFSIQAEHEGKIIVRKLLK
jgi:GNAT superfamily N-acetyltransferase